VRRLVRQEALDDLNPDQTKFLPSLIRG